MFLKINNIIFIVVLIFSTLAVVSSRNWIIAWVCLEINLISLVPLMIFKIKFKNSSASIKYFLVQAMASTLLLRRVLVTTYLTYFESLVPTLDIVNVSLALKLGMPPFQLWIPQIIEVINIIKIRILLIWQKIAPIAIISYSTRNLITTIIIIRALIGAVGAINQNNLKKIFFYSSLNHLAWIMTSIIINEILWALYLVFYSSIILPLLFIFNRQKTKTINKINEKKFSFVQIFFLILIVLSLAGLPPFLGFRIKIIIISLISINIWTYFISIALISSSVTSMYYYFKIIWTTFMCNSTKTKINIPKKNIRLKLYMSGPLLINLLTPMGLWFY